MGPQIFLAQESSVFGLPCSFAHEYVHIKVQRFAGKPGATTSYTENSTRDPVEPKRVLYSYYTAGSGGVGPTILETSLLLAGTPVIVYVNGEKVSPSRLYWESGMAHPRSMQPPCAYATESSSALPALPQMIFVHT